jgi:3-oxoacyl-[acyl-carrier-protein] synthase II
MAASSVPVTGLGAVSSLGVGVPALWDGLVAGRCGIRPLTRLDPEAHRIRHAGEVPGSRVDSSVGTDDLAFQYALAACREALGAIPENERGGIAIVLGSNFGAMARTERLLDGDAESPGPHFIGDVTDAVGGALRLGGVRSTLSLSCASGNAAIGRAADLIRTGRAEIALACGYDAISEIVWAGLCSLRAMTQDVLRPFDRRRDGTIFSEGAGAMLLESVAHASRRGARPAAHFLGYATTSNAFHMTHPDADGAGMARAMRDALRDAGLTPESVDHINAHATGTLPNDKLETAAIKSVFGGRAGSIPINGLKSMLGHAMGAASALEAVATVLTIQNGIIPPTIHLEEPDPECDLDYVPNVAREVKVRCAMNNSAGFGGCNASVIFGGAA